MISDTAGHATCEFAPLRPLECHCHPHDAAPSERRIMSALICTYSVGLMHGPDTPISRPSFSTQAQVPVEPVGPRCRRHNEERKKK